MPPDEDRFPQLKKAAAELHKRGEDLSLAELRALLCYDCDFYGDDHEDDLECSCFKMLRILLVRGVLTPSRLAEELGSAGNTGQDE
jgi:hypothetical protein